MVHISFVDVVKVLSGTVLKASNRAITGVSVHADFVNENNIFFCINSSKYNSSDGSLGFTNNEDSVYGFGGFKNGHYDIYKAVEKGATVVVIDDIKYFDESLDIGFILVTDSLNSLKFLASYHIKQTNVKVIAVTGSTGKTTTSHEIVNSLSSFLHTKWIHRIRNSVLAMCLEILQNLSIDDDCLVVEMQIDGFGQIDKFCEIAKPDIAIITNINNAHYSRFESIERILYEKMSVYRNLNKDGKIIINDDNELLHKWSVDNKSDIRILKVGTSEYCDYIPLNISTYGEYKFLMYDAYIKKVNLSHIQLQTSGVGALYASLFSLAIADLLNLNLEDFVYCLKNIISPVGRFSCFEGLNGSLVIIDSYNANIFSMKQGIEYISKSPRSRKILILGSMLELAEKTESEHRVLGKLIDGLNEQFYIITIGEAAMYITAEFNNILPQNVFCTFTYEDIIDVINILPIDNDTIVFIKGSGAMRMEIIAPYLLSKRLF